MNCLSWLDVVKDFVPSVATVLAIVALVGAWYQWYRQRELQLKLTLFDKRFAVFREVEKFKNLILMKNGSIDLLTDYPPFQDAMEQAKYLFPKDSDVVPYLTEVGDKARRLFDLAMKRDHDKVMGNVQPSSEIYDLMVYFGDQAIPKRNEVFGPHLQFK